MPKNRDISGIPGVSSRSRSQSSCAGYPKRKKPLSEVKSVRSCNLEDALVADGEPPSAREESTPVIGICPTLHKLDVARHLLCVKDIVDQH